MDILDLVEVPLEVKVDYDWVDLINALEAGSYR